MTSSDEEPAQKIRQQPASQTKNDQQQQQERAKSPVQFKPSSNIQIDTQSEIEQLMTNERPFDVIIFAASSSVGRYLVEELALVVDKYYNTSTSGQPDQAATATASAAAAKQHHPGELPSSSQLRVNRQFLQQLRRRSVPSSCNFIKWAVAGRSAVRLSETLCQAELSTGIRNLSTAIQVLLADLNHQRSLLNMCQKARLVINCAGPYSELGAEMLIQACIHSGTHYVDLAHETTFVESIGRLYSERARLRNVLILNGCGFQSMSAECGINFMKQVVDGRIEQVKIILSMSDTSALIRLGSSGSGGPSVGQSAVGIVTRGMWNSLLAEKSQEISIEERMRRQQQQVLAGRRQELPLASTSEFSISECHEDEDQSLKRLQKQEDETRSLGNDANNQNNSLSRTAGQSNERKNTQWLVKDIVQFRNRAVSIAWPLQLIQGFQIQKGRGYCWPVDTLTSDESQLIRSEMNNYELRRPDLDSSDGWRPIRTSSYISVKNFTRLCLLFIWLFLFQILIKFSPTRYLMRKLPGLASLGHVTPQTASGRTSLSSSSGYSTRQQVVDRDALSHIKYCQTFIAYGQPSDSSGDPLEERRKHTARRQAQLLVSRVVGPEPNHVATATFAIQAALTILMERDHLPASGGVLTPGAAFAETNIIYQLRRRNIKFEVLKKA